jgi:uncharacterized protein (DUF1330 family)
MAMKMQSWTTLMVGIALGGLTTFTLAGPTRSVYVVTEVDEITDSDNFESLKKAMTGVVEAEFQDGRYLARTQNITALDGAAPKAIVIIAFDSEAKAKAYHDNIKELSAVRMRTSKSRSFMVGLCSERGKLLAHC